MSVMRFTLYSRSYCHLCSDMAAALEAARRGRDFQVDVIDLEDHPELEARYGELVPVLVLGGREVFHYHFDEALLEAALAAHEAPDRPAQRAEFG
ncbi:MAG: glutaredoxin family protein [Betaproteobacteria bacterium]|nr:glutaredoxin family protein [Betaproteobacteria bacterium]